MGIDPLAHSAVEKKLIVFGLTQKLLQATGFQLFLI